MNIHFLQHRLSDLWDSFFTTPFVQIEWKAAGVRMGDSSRFWGIPVLHKATGSEIIIGKHFQARSRPSSNSVGTIQPVVLSTTSAEAKITMGDNIGMSGATISCRREVRFGDRVGLGSGCLIMDNDAHPLDASERSQQKSGIRTSPVLLDDDVWIGARAIVLKGTCIGKRSIVQAGSVVCGSFPADCILGGNPAMIISSKVQL